MERWRRKEFILVEPMWRAQYAREFQGKVWGAADIPGYHIHFPESGRDEWREESSLQAEWESELSIVGQMGDVETGNC